jgi:hypothetical protein
MNCRLCLKNRSLQNSHIVPEFLYVSGYDEKHRQIDVQAGRSGFKYIQKGLREPLLCAECEQLLNREYETYFHRFWYRTVRLPKTTRQAAIHLPNFDYSRFKLFHLSILWRASVSSLEEYSQVSLGEYEEPIRKMLIDKQPLTPYDYPLWGTVVLFPASKRILHGLVSTPMNGNLNSMPVYMFLYGGCVWDHVIVTEQIGRKLPIALHNNGTMTLPVRDLQEIKPLSTFFADQNQIESKR